MALLILMKNKEDKEILYEQKENEENHKKRRIQREIQ